MGNKFDPFGGLPTSQGLRSGMALGNALGGIFRAILERSNRAAKEAEAREHNEALLTSPPPVHGSAGWPHPEEVLAAGFGSRNFTSLPSGRGLRLGSLLGAPDLTSPPAALLDWDGEGHILTVAPTRSGKATTLIVPNLLSYRGSAIVLDPKGELFELTSRWRQSLGPVYRIALFDRQDRHEAGYPRDRFNPLAGVRSVGDARALASLLLPPDAKAQAFFNKDAVSFLTAAILYLLDVAPTKSQTISELRRMTSLPLQAFKAMLRRMQDSPIAEVRNGANVVTFKSADRGLPNLIDTLNADLSLWTDPDVAYAVSGTDEEVDLNFESLKDKTATVYVTVPFDKLRPFAPFTKVLLRTALDAMVQNPRVPEIPVLFVLDEFLALDDASDVVDAIRTHAGSGVRLWFILQDIGALKNIYGDGGEAVFNTALKIWFGTNDHVTAERLSKELGTATVGQEKLSFTFNSSVSRGDPFQFPTQTHGTSTQRHVDLHGRPLLMPDEIRKRMALVAGDGTRLAITQLGPFVGTPVRLMPFFRTPWCLERVGCTVQVVASSDVARRSKA